MTYFVDQRSIVRKIWGNADTILLIFAGASAEFALNKAVDWLYFTGRLPADPLKRLFSTVAYARKIVFSEYGEAIAAIDKIAAIHKGVENERGKNIPDWAYRDVLFMLIDYSIRAHELMAQKLTPLEKAEVYNVFYRMGTRMGVKELPPDYDRWELMRNAALQENLLNGHFTKDLYKQYKKHLGGLRYLILIQTQALLVPGRVNALLHLGRHPFSLPILNLYKLGRKLGFDKLLKNVILPSAYKEQIAQLDHQTA
jgi:hypothetical protein